MSLKAAKLLALLTATLLAMGSATAQAQLGTVDFFNGGLRHRGPDRALSHVFRNVDDPYWLAAVVNLASTSTEQALPFRRGLFRS